MFILALFLANSAIGFDNKDKNESTIDNFNLLELSDQHTQKTFRQCLPYTLQKTVKLEPDDTTYIITGDIPAMWVRDSCAQIYPYVYLSKNSYELQRIIQGTILRHIKHFNSSYEDAPFINSWQEDYTYHEKKFEPDGIAYLIRLTWLYWKITGDEKWAHKTGDFDAHAAFNHALDTLKKYTDPTVQMVKCKHRPSDDETVYPYLIPTNMFLTSMLPKLAEMYTKIWNDATRADECNSMSQNIKTGINKYGIYDHPLFGKIWAYEVDGGGNVWLMDDANIPSLLSVPYLEFCAASDATYQNTRQFIFSSFNPYYISGKYGQGVGSPHSDNLWIWPISLIMQALTTENTDEIQKILQYLNNLDNGTYSVRESVNPNNPSQHTRDSFAWGNALYAELLITKILGFNFYPDNSTSYLKPHLNPECNKATLKKPVNFGNKSSITLQLEGKGAVIDAAKINGEKAEIDKIKGVKIPKDNVDILIHTTSD